LAAFFLHAKVLERINDVHPDLFSGSSKETKELNRFKTRGAIIEMANNGMFGTMKEVEKVGVYEFFEALDYLRIKAKIQNGSN
jgi:hypothetical protein